MPRYLFECRKCGRRGEPFFKMSEVPSAIECADWFCGGLMTQTFSPPQIITNPHRFREENNPYWGKSETDIKAERKKEDAAYEKTWAKSFTPPDPQAEFKRKFPDYEPTPFVEAVAAEIERSVKDGTDE